MNSGSSQALSPADVERYRRNYLSEKDGAFLYRELATAEKDTERSAIFRKLAEAEERHAERWAALLEKDGTLRPRHRPTAQVRLLSFMARRLGAERVLPIVTNLEARDEERYIGQPEASGLAAEERGHRRVLSTLRAGARGATVPDGILAREQWHHRGQSGSLRAAVFGVNDGLVSNFSLVMGIAGADVGANLVLLSGVAGLLAGAFSMAAGEYISMRAQREMFERQIELEKDELEMAPEEEEEELALIYQAKGITEKQAARLAAEIIDDPSSALDTLVREELGLDPTELGSPWTAALSSFSAFCLGAFVPILPFLVPGNAPIVWSALSSGAALFAVGAVLSIFTGRGMTRSGFRMLFIGSLAASATYAVGHLLGVAVAG